MAHQIIGIGRVRVAVADLAAAIAVFGRLGFHPGPMRREAGAAVADLSIGSFQVEIVESAARRGGSARFVGLGFGSRDLALSRESLRRADIPISGGATRLIGLPEEVTACLPAAICPIGPPDGGDHPNTAKGVVSVTAVLDNPEAASPGFNRLFGPAACTPTDELVTVHSGRGLLFLVTPSGFDDLHPSLDIRLPPAPAIAVLTIGVADIGRAAAVLTGHGIAAKRWGGHLGVPAGDSLGIGLEFAES